MTDFRTHSPRGDLHRDPFPVVRVSPEKLARAFYWLPTDNIRRTDRCDDISMDRSSVGSVEVGFAESHRRPPPPVPCVAEK